MGEQVSMKDIEKLQLITRICRSAKLTDPIRDILAVAVSTFMDDTPERLLRELNSDEARNGIAPLQMLNRIKELEKQVERLETKLVDLTV